MRSGQSGGSPPGGSDVVRQEIDGNRGLAGIIDRSSRIVLPMLPPAS